MRSPRAPQNSVYLQVVSFVDPDAAGQVVPLRRRCQQCPFPRYHLRNIQPNETLPFSIIDFVENWTTKPKEGRYVEDVVVQGCRGGLRLRGERGDGGEKGEDFGTFLDRAGFLAEYPPGFTATRFSVIGRRTEFWRVAMNNSAASAVSQRDAIRPLV
jgi:hypothetical protein